MEISTLPIAPLGAGGLVAVIILAILKGALIPRSVHDDRMRDKDKQIDALQAANAELLAQNTTLLQVGHTAERVLVSLREAAGKSEGEPHEVAPS